MLLFAYILLAAGALLAWYGVDRPATRWRGYGCIVAQLGLLFAFVAGVLGVTALVVGTTGLIYGYTRAQFSNPLSKTMGDMVIVALAIGLGLHLIPGFPTVPLMPTASSGALAAPSFANTDKALAGVLLLALVPATRRGDWRGWLVIPLGTVAVLLLGLSAGLTWRPHWHQSAPILLAVNLMSTIIAEEALFRGLIQERVRRLLKGMKHSQWIALAIASLAFGLAHWQGGGNLMVLATVAGVVYGLAYHLTGKLSAAIVAHLGVNACAFFLLAA